MKNHDIKVMEQEIKIVEKEIEDGIKINGKDKVAKLELYKSRLLDHLAALKQNENQ